MKTGAVVALVGAAVGLVGVALSARPRRRSLPPHSVARLEGLHLTIAGRAVRLVGECLAKGIRLVVVSGCRSFAEQDALYARGRTAPGSIVTPLRGGESWHNFGLAFDVGVLDENGTITWPEDDLLWEKIGRAGEGVGLIWGGRFPAEQRDRPHFEFHPGLSIADARAGARPTVGA